MTSGPSTADAAARRVWDLPTRLFHWTLVLLVISAWATAYYAEELRDATLRWHRWNGYAVLVLLAWRLLWGFVGSPASRFSSFIGSPAAALRYGLDVARGKARRFLGHNPLGAWMVIALILAVLAQAVVGLFTTEHNDLASGPLARWAGDDLTKPIRRWHHFVFDKVILPLATLHIVANLFYALVKREPLIRAMVTGVKPAGDYEDSPRLATAGDSSTDTGTGRVLLRAVLCLAAAVAIVFAPLLAFGGRL